ncbi:MAG: hypothetical protein ACRC2R_02465 [Xenococcaceae cyanobacterium]
MQNQDRGINNEYNSSLVDTTPKFASIQEKSRWLLLKSEKAAKNRTDSMLKRSASEIGLV